MPQFTTVRTPQSPVSTARRIASSETRDECASCAGDVTCVSMERHGLDLLFVSCSTCDSRVWTLDGMTVDLDQVLSEMSEAATVAVQDTKQKQRMTSDHMHLGIQQVA